MRVLVVTSAARRSLIGLLAVALTLLGLPLLNAAPASASVGTGVVLGGTVTGPTSTPVSGIEVQVFRVGTGGLASVGYASTAADGTWQLPGSGAEPIAAGSFEIQIYGGTYPDRWYPAADTSAGAIPVTLVDGQVRTDLNVALTDGYSISGHVTIRGGGSPAGISVLAQTNGYDNPRYATVAADGSYQVSGLSNGDWNVLFSGSSTVNIVAQYYPNTPSTGMPAPVTVAGASRTGIDTEITPGATISGTIALAGAAPGTTPSVPDVFIAGTRNSLSGLDSVTSTDGTYTIFDLPAGSYDVRFRQQGYATQWWNGQAAQATATAIAVGEGGAATSVDAALTIARSVSGSVTDVHGVALPSEDVSIGSYYDDMYQDTSTDGGGAFTLSGIRPSTVTIAANSQYYGDDTHLSATKDVTVSSSDVTGVTVVLPDAGVVTGHIHRLDNSAVSSASVTLQTYDTQSGWYDSSYGNSADFNGAFRFGSLVPGTTYRVRASDVTGLALDDTSAPFVAVAGPQVEDIVLAPGASISGTVTGPGGTPLAGITVTGSGGSVSQSTVSDGAGHYTLSPFPTGTYEVTFTGGTQYLDATVSAVPVTQPATTTVDRQLAAASIIKGTVVDGHGVPVANAPVSVQPLGAPLTCSGPSAQTAGDGSFTIGGLPAGSYVVTFGNPDPTCYYGSGTIVGEYWQDKGPGQTPTPVVLASGATATLAAQVTRYSVLSGTVTAGGNALGGVSLQVWPVGASDFLTSTAVDASGNYQVAVPPGDYKLQIVSFSGDQRRPAFWYSSATDRVEATVVTVGVETDQSGLDITAPFTGALTGHITASGVPSTNAYVTVYDSRDRWVSDANTDQQGAYRVGGLPSGQYRIEVSDYGNHYGQDFWVGGSDFASATVQNVTDGATSTVDIAEPAGPATGTMSLTVTAGSAPAAGQATVIDAATGDYITSCQLDSGGLCSGLPVQAGSYKVQISSQSPNYADTWYGGTTQATATIVGVTAGTDTPLSIALRGAGSIDLTVTNDSAASLDHVFVSARQSAGGDASSSDQVSIASGASAKSTLTYLPVGTYQVTASHQGEVTTTSVTVTAGATTPVSLSLVSADVSTASGTISGLVQDSLGAAVAGASVCTDDSYYYYDAWCGTTAADGAYSITGVPAGYYGLQVTGLPVGLAVQSALPTVLVDPQHATSVAAPTITVVAGATATGIITRSGGTPTSDVHVRLYRGHQLVGEAFSGMTGAWSIAALPPGSYTVEADAESDLYEPTWYPNAATQPSATAVALTTGHVTSSLDIALTSGKAGSRVSVTSSTATGVGSTVTLTATVVSALTGGATPTGTVQFSYAGTDIGAPVALNGSGVATATVAVSQIEADAGASYSGSATYGVANGGTWITATGIATTTQLVSPPTTATAGASVSLTASVGDVGPGAAPTGWVEFFTDDGTWLGTTQLITNTATISTSALFAGNHVIWASYGGDATHQSSRSANAALAASPAGPTLGHIQGTVTSGPAQPVANVTVDLYNATGPAFARETTTASDGTYAFGAVPAGSYLIRYSGSGITTEWWQDQSSSGTATPLTVTNGALTTASPTVTVVAPFTGSVSGTVTAAAGGAPVANAWVQACTTTAPTLCGYAQTDSGGAYSVGALADGTYHVLIQPWGVGLAQSDADINVSGGGNVNHDASLSALVVPPAAVTVTAADGVTSDNVPTATWNDTTPFSYTACVAGTGTYMVTDASNATVKTGSLTEGPAGHYTATIPALSPVVGMLTVSATVVCPSGPPATVAFNLYIDPSGNVVDTHGNPISGATVTLSLFDPSTSTYIALPSGSDVMSPSNRVNPDLTDINGHFGWNVQAGHYKVTASKVGCYLPGAPGTPAVSTGDLQVPPAVTDVSLVLQCSSGAVAPGAPTAVTAIAGAASAAVSWSAPASNGGSAVTGFTVTASPGGASCSAVAPTTSCSVTGLTNGTSYTFTVTATNAVGTSGTSAASSPVTPRTVPGAPSGPVAVAGHGSATVSWSAPASDGGSAVSGYSVTATPGGASCTAVAPTTSCTVSGLSNGTPYTFTVTASNVVGASSPSAASAAVTPTAAPVAPGAPSGPVAVAGHGSATVSWSAPASDGGSAVTGYSVVASPGGATCTSAASVTSCVVSGLSNGTPYTFTVTATNGVGTSGPSAPSAAVTPTAVDVTAPTVSVPALPVGTMATAVRLTWSGADAGSGVASYDVQYRKAAWNATGFGPWVLPAAWQHTTARSATLALAVGVDYCVSVRARDVAGNVSGWSAPRCTARALDDRAMVAGAGWTRSPGTSYYLRTISATSTVGKVLTRTGARLDRVGIVATRCAKCGIVGVYVGTKLIGKVNLALATTKRQQLVMLAPFSYRSGTITIKTLTSGKLVQIDGLLITRS